MSGSSFSISAAVGLAFGLVTLVFPNASASANSRYSRDQAAGPIVVQSHYIPAGVTATFETTNLRANSHTVVVPDTVIHVFDSNWSQIAANDDCGSELRSCVTLPASGGARTVTVYIRAYANVRFGLANYRSTIGGTVNNEDFFFGGTAVSAGTLPSNTWVETVEQSRGYAFPGSWDGSSDTVMMVLNGTTGVVNVNDDSGVMLMSKLRTTAHCDPCTIVVGDYASVGGWSMAKFGYTTLIWSSDTTDSDGDGLPNELETYQIGTSAFNSDHDADGIPDGVETIGLDHGTLLFPKYGALPWVKDLFLEIDYMQGSPMWSGADAEEFARAYRINGFKRNPGGTLLSFEELNSPSYSDSRDIRVHLDIGVTNNGNNGVMNDTRLSWGNWAGSSTVSSDADCSGLTPMRNSNAYWHHLVSGTGNNSGYGRCGRGWPGLGAGVHEVGHQLGLEHGGYPTGGPNGSVMYASVMNYQFGRVDQDPAFSTKRWSQVLNPSSVNEVFWGGSGTNKVSYVNSSFTPARFFNNNNEIDFNSDGSYASGGDRAFGTFSRDTGGAFHNAWSNGGVNTDVELAWLPVSPMRLYMFHLYTSGATSRLEYRYTTNTANCDLKQAHYWASCVTFTGATQIAGTSGVKRFFGVERVNVNGVWKILVVFVDATDKLRYLTLDQNGASAVADVTSGQSVTTGPGLVRVSDSRVLVFAGVGAPARLNGWEYDGNSNSWPSARVPQSFAPDAGGSPVEVGGFGVSLTRGYMIDTGTSVQIVGALHSTNNAINMVRYDSATQLWRPLAGLNASGIFWSDGKLAVSYVPYVSWWPYSGRYYLMYTRPAARRNTFLVRTVGNDPNAVADPSTGLEPRALKWRRGGAEEYLSFEWDGSLDGTGLDLLYDMTYDNHLRAGWLPWGPPNYVGFMPVADGHFNLDLVDSDDWVVMSNNLRCSLGQCPRQ